MQRNKRCYLVIHDHVDPTFSRVLERVHHLVVVEGDSSRELTFSPPDNHVVAVDLYDMTTKRTLRHGKSAAERE